MGPLTKLKKSGKSERNSRKIRIRIRKTAMKRKMAKSILKTRKTTRKNRLDHQNHEITELVPDLDHVTGTVEVTQSREGIHDRSQKITVTKVAAIDDPIATIVPDPVKIFPGKVSEEIGTDHVQDHGIAISRAL